MPVSAITKQIQFYDRDFGLFSLFLDAKRMCTEWYNDRIIVGKVDVLRVTEMWWEQRRKWNGIKPENEATEDLLASSIDGVGETHQSFPSLYCKTNFKGLLMMMMVYLDSLRFIQPNQMISLLVNCQLTLQIGSKKNFLERINKLINNSAQSTWMFLHSDVQHMSSYWVPLLLFK